MQMNTQNYNTPDDSPILSLIRNLTPFTELTEKEKHHQGRAIWQEVALIFVTTIEIALIASAIIYLTIVNNIYEQDDQDPRVLAKTIAGNIILFNRFFLFISCFSTFYVYQSLMIGVLGKVLPVIPKSIMCIDTDDEVLPNITTIKRFRFENTARRINIASYFLVGLSILTFEVTYSPKGGQDNEAFKNNFNFISEITFLFAYLIIATLLCIPGLYKGLKLVIKPTRSLGLNIYGLCSGKRKESLLDDEEANKNYQSTDSDIFNPRF